MSIKEEVPANNVGDGHVAGLGVGKQGEPGVKRFAGARVFKVPNTYFQNARLMKRKYARYEQYVGDDEIGKQIREFGNKNYGEAIVLEDELTGAMCYLRYGNGK